jgi:S-adenosylmethionine hydrolase
MPRPIVTLTTDYGDEGYYVGVLRGVLLSQCPDAVLVDITHRIAPYSPLEGSFVLAQAVPAFPRGTVHLAVVDPGVGGLRKPLVVEQDGSFLVGPDNGLFTPFFRGGEKLYVLDPEAAPGELSATFHGRDLFAPAAARLARGESPEAFARPTHQAVRLSWPRPRREGGGIAGQVLTLDRFGNLISNIHRGELAELGDRVDVRVGTSRIPGLSRTYQDGAVGDALALVGSSGFLEIAVVQGNAGAQLGVGKGERVRVVPLE